MTYPRSKSITSMLYKLELPSATMSSTFSQTCVSGRCVARYSSMPKKVLAVEPVACSLLGNRLALSSCFGS